MDAMRSYNFYRQFAPESRGCSTECSEEAYQLRGRQIYQFRYISSNMSEISAPRKANDVYDKFFSFAVGVA